MTCTTTEPAAALFLFDFLRMQARGCGFVDVNQVFFTINMTVSGFDNTSPDYEELRHKLEQAWTHTEYVYTVEERDDKGNKKLIRLEEYPPHVEGETGGGGSVKGAAGRVEGGSERG
jgi:hypothetical protein